MSMPGSGRVAAILGACLLVGALVVGVWWWRSVQDTAPGVSQGPGETSASSGMSGGDNARVLTFRTRLLADAGVSALPDSVRIGLANVSPDELAAYQAWLRSGGEGAGPRRFEDLAAVTRWLNAPAIAAGADGAVTVGPIDLPAADRYVLQARAGDGLRFYEATFTRDEAPDEVRPRVAAGLRIRAPQRTRRGAAVLLRRVEGAQDAEWQSLLRRETPALLDAYDERPFKVGPEDTVLAPLPPGPVDVIAVVDGVETERRRVMLSAGRFATLDFDPEASALGAALSVDVALRLIDKSSGQPVSDAAVVWVSPRGERMLQPDAAGTMRVEGVDPLQPMQLDLRFAPPKTASFLIEALPSWPERLPMTLDLADAPVVRGVIARTIEVEPLRWLIVETPGVEMQRRPRVGDPFPIFVLQRRNSGQWRESPADYFRPVPGGLAVSLDAPGTVRVVAVLSPWHVRTSASVDVSPSPAGTRYRTRVEASAGRSVTLRIADSRGPLVGAPVHLLPLLRGVPAKTLTTDGAGQVLLDDATESSVLVEVPGYVQTRVVLDRTVVPVVLARDQP